VSEIGLDFDFSSDLFLDLALLQLGLVQHFEGADELLGAFSSQVHTTKFAFAEWLADFKHAKVEGFRSGGLIKEN
jgi:hypothetical protein